MAGGPSLFGLHSADFPYALFVRLLQKFSVLLAVSLSSRDKILEKYAIIYDFHIEDKEGSQASDSNTVDIIGGIDFWGNCWEWISSDRQNGKKGVKGGAYDSPRLSCRTEYREEARDPQKGYDNVGFRIVCIK